MSHRPVTHQRTWLLLCLLPSVFCLLSAPAGAQSPKVEITGVRVGYNAARAQRAKVGLWAPVYIDVQTRNDRLVSNEYDLVVETTDSDDMQNVYVERRPLLVPTLEPREARMLMSYVRLGNESSEVSVNLRWLKDGRPIQTLAKAKAKPGDFEGVNSSAYLYLTLGGSLPGLKRALVAARPGADPQQTDEPEESGNRRFAHLDTIDLLPANWFGYQSADLVLLTTSSEKFVTDLIAADELATARLKAIAEWVRRGGTLLISVGHNHQQVNKVLEIMGLIDLKVQGQVPGLKDIPGLGSWVSPGQGVEALRSVPSRTNPGERPDIEVARLVCGQGVRTLAVARGDVGDRGAIPVVVQAPAGLGRVLVVALDVDQPPFTTWKGQKPFWDAVRRQVEPAGIDTPNQPNQLKGGFYYGESQEIAARFQDSLEAFPDVTVISFGWVALFILVYILIVGPLDYFFLKKVVKRLELTWITFPTVVIIISTIAYFAAYYLKGNDLRINKVDVVDIDLRQPHVYGSTWFTLFSPRIQNYTIGIEPNTTAWGEEPKAVPGADPARSYYSPVVGWMGKPENVWGGTGRGGSQGLFRRAYDYAPESSGLLGVPIGVWTTKSFTASYHRPIGEKELIEADLHFTRADPGKVGGVITSRLPVELQDVVVFYAGNAWSLDTLAPNDSKRLDLKDIRIDKRQGDVPLNTWFAQGYFRPNAPAVSTRGRPYYGPQPNASPGMTVKSMLFFGHAQDSTISHGPGQMQIRNSTLRHLSQTWRLDRQHRDEAILVGRAVLPGGKSSEGGAEDITQSGLSPSKLWLGELPGLKDDGVTRKARPPLVGSMYQETYVRVFIPVNPAEGNR